MNLHPPCRSKRRWVRVVPGLFCLLLMGTWYVPVSAAFNRCATATLKAFLIFEVGEAEMWRPDCSIKWPAGHEQPMVITFRYTRDIPARAFRKAATNFLEKNQVTVSPEIERFNQAYQDVQDGDVYRLTFRPEDGLELSLNGKVLAHLSPEEGWQYFAVWLGKRPFNAKLKAQLLAEAK